MISIERVYNQLEQQSGFISVVELTMIIGGSVAEVRQRLNELGDRVAKNEHDEWRVVGEVFQKLELSPLSASEIEERDELENTVSQAFYVAGQALKVLRDKKLYRETHATFEAYIRDRFGYTKRKVYYLIDAVEVVNNLKSEPLVHFLPTNERQCREVAKLPVEIQPQAWLTSVERAGDKVPSARIIKEVVKEIKSEPQMESKPKPDRIIRTPGMETEYLIYSDRETYELLQAYKERIGAATNNGAIRKLLMAENQRDR